MKVEEGRSRVREEIKCGGARPMFYLFSIVGRSRSSWLK